MNRKEKAAAFLEEGYNITVTGRHVMLTDAMRDYAIEKVSKIERFTNRILDVVITMEVQKLDQKVDIVMKVNNLKIKSSAQSDNMYVSIDQAVDKIQTQLLRYKEKLQNHQAKGVQEVDMNVNVIRPGMVDEEDMDSEIYEESAKHEDSRMKPHEVVSKETKPLKTLNLDEAIMKMELSQDAFMVFRSEEDHKLKVIYRRSDDNYGVIEPAS